MILASQSGSIIAPAGCGKTQLIALSVRAMTSGRALVLTHTHSGLSALKNRLEKLGVQSGKANVQTIAGWSLRYAQAYPKLSGLASPNPTGKQWDEVYRAAKTLLGFSAIRAVVAASYTCVFIDEYQDCVPDQHEVAVLLSKIVPTWVFGDPLQAIFGFAGANLSWKNTVEAAFPKLGELNTPWRWKGVNEPLGNWLLSIREDLLAGNEIDLGKAPVTWHLSEPANARSAAFQLAKVDERAVVIRSKKQAAHQSARALGGLFPAMEEMDCTALMDFADQLDGASGTARAARVLEFAGECFTEVSTVTKNMYDNFVRGKLPAGTRSAELKPLAAALIAVAGDRSPSFVQLAMRKIEELKGAKLFRRELWREAFRTLGEAQSNQGKPVREVAWDVRSRARYGGRAVEKRMVSRTLLVKGLEFDHALILNADEFEDRRQPGTGAKNFYVAATRGCKSLVILSAAQKISFTAVNNP